MVSGPTGQLCPQVSCGGSGLAGSLRHTAQSSRLVTHQTGPPVGAGGPEQDGILLHHCTGTPGTATENAAFKAIVKLTFNMFWASSYMLFPYMHG